MLTFIYIALLSVGAIIIAATMYSLRNQFMPGHQARPAGEQTLFRLLPLSLGVGLFVFGVAGLVLAPVLDQQGIERSVVVALGAGLLAAFIAQVALYYWAAGRALPPSIAQEPQAGQQAEVILPIPANGVGQIVYETEAGRMTIGARSATTEGIAAGQTVLVERVGNRMAVVSQP